MLFRRKRKREQEAALLATLQAMQAELALLRIAVADEITDLRETLHDTIALARGLEVMLEGERVLPENILGKLWPMCKAEADQQLECWREYHARVSHEA